MAMLNNQRVYPINIPLNPIKPPLNPIEIAGLPIKNGDFPWQTVSHNQRLSSSSTFNGFSGSPGRLKRTWAAPWEVGDSSTGTNPRRDFGQVQWSQAGGSQWSVAHFVGKPTISGFRTPIS